MSGKGTFSSSRQVQRKLQSVVKELREHPDVQDIRDVLDECSRKKRRRSNDADTDNVMDSLFSKGGTDKYLEDINSFINDIEDCVKKYAGIRRKKQEDVSFLYYFYEVVLAHLGKIMTQVEHARITKIVDSNTRPVEQPKQALTRKSLSSVDGSSFRERYLSILTMLKKNKNSSAFLHPVDVTAAPGYLDVVKIPMDLSTVTKNVKEGKYDKLLKEFASDMRLIWNNCMTYNAPGSSIYECAKELGAIFEGLFESNFSEHDNTNLDKSVKIRDPRCSKILNAVKRDKRAADFLFPVDVNEAPGYTDVVKKPMDLSKVADRLTAGKYDYHENSSVDTKSKKVNEFASDMRLIWSNCMSYNAPGSAIYESAKELSEYFERMFLSHFKEGCDDENEHNGFKDAADVKIRDSRYAEIMTEMRENPNAAPFLFPVELSAAPGYLDVVVKPMDLTTLQERIDHGRYDYSASATLGGKSKMVNYFANDMRLIWNNCMAYNAPGSPIYESSKELGRFFERIFESLFKIGFPDTPQRAASPVEEEDRVQQVRDMRYFEILNALKKDKNAKYFLKPVDLAAAPGYLDVVKKPMDLSLVTKRLEQGKYDYAASASLYDKSKMINFFASDMRLIWSNCTAYNEPGYSIYDCSEKLGERFETLFVSMFSEEFREYLTLPHGSANDSMPSVLSGSRSKRTRTLKDNAEESSILTTDSKIIKILSSIKKDKRTSNFLLPVDTKAAPGYTEVIKKPMDLGTVTVQLKEGKYDYSESASIATRSKAVNEFASDMRLIWNNCMTYNAPGSAIYQSAKELGDTFEKMFESNFKDELSRYLTRPKRKAVDRQGENGTDKSESVRDLRYSKILTSIKKHKSSGFFLLPVDTKAAPGYTEVIKKPMDLGTVTIQLKEGKYDYSESASIATRSKAVNEFASDMRLIWNNCMTYNAPGSAIYESAKELGDTFEKMFESNFKDEFSRYLTRPKRKAVDSQGENGTDKSESVRDLRYSKILTSIKKHKSSGFFLLPVDTKAAPGYTEVIKKPMDLGTVTIQLKEGKYDYSESASIATRSKAVNEFASDMRLIWNNCMTYNAPGSAIYESAKELGDTFEKMFESNFKDEFSRYLTRPKRKAVDSQGENGTDKSESVRDLRYSKILTSIKKHKSSGFFLLPVDTKAAPGYTEVIKKPMDLGTVTVQLKEGKYDYSESASIATRSKAVNEFASDMRLIWNNCMTYNVLGSAIYESAKELGKYFEHQFETHFGNDDSILLTKYKRPQCGSTADRDMKKEIMSSQSIEEKIKGPKATSSAKTDKLTGEKNNEKTKKKETKESKESKKADNPGCYITPQDYNEKRFRKLQHFMKALIFHPLSLPFVGHDNDEEMFPPRNFKTIQNHLDYYANRRIDEFIDHIHGVMEYINVMASKNGLKCTKQFDYELNPNRNSHLAIESNLQLTIDTPTFYALIQNKFQVDCFPSIYFKNWKDKKKFYLPLSVRTKSQSLEKKTAQNEMAKAALVEVREDIRTQDIGGNGADSIAPGSPESIPPVEEDMFVLSDEKFGEMYKELGCGVKDCASECAAEPLKSIYVRECASRYAQAGHKHWVAQYSGTFHEREGQFLEIKYANTMYKVVDFGKITGEQCFLHASDNNFPQRHDYLYPLGYKCLRTLVLCLIPADDVRRSRLKRSDAKFKPIQPPDAYSHIEIEFVSEIVRPSNGKFDQSPHVLRISIGRNVTVVERELCRPDSCKEAWASCLQASMGFKILRALGAPLRRCRAVLNRLCTLPFIMPFLECIPITKQKPSLAYYDAIKAPMWLREVHRRLTEGCYEYVSDFAWDVRLVFTNCFEYNLPGSPLYENAAKALKFFELLLCQWVYNVQDVSIDELASGPWDMWMHLKYFDGHTVVSSAVSGDVHDMKEVSSSHRRTKGSKDQDLNRCCVSNSLGSLSQPLLFCELCEDSYHIDVPEAKLGQYRDKIWVCRRCATSPDMEAVLDDPNALLKMCPNEIVSDTADAATMKVEVDDVLHDGSRSFCGQFLPAPELGIGWCATRAEHEIKFLSPLGYVLSSSLEAYRHIFDEYDSHQSLLEARQIEFAAEREGINGDGEHRSAKKKTKKKDRSGLATSDILNNESDTMLTCGKVAILDDVSDYSFVWMGFMGEVEFPDRAYLPRTKIMLEESRLAIKQPKSINTTNISSMFGTWSKDPELKTHLSILNLNVDSSEESNNMLTAAGLTGLDDPVIHFCIEGLEGLERTIECLNEAHQRKDVSSQATQRYCYEYMYAAPILSELQQHARNVDERRAAMSSGERRLKSILSAEKVAYSDFLQKEAELIANIRELDASDDFNDFRGMSNNQMVPLWPADWTVTDLDTEVLLKIWEFLGSLNVLLGKHCFGLYDLCKTIVIPQCDVKSCLPNVSTVLFDELCCNLTSVLLSHIKDSVFFPGIKALLKDSRGGPEDPDVCKRQLFGFAAKSAASLGDGLYNGPSKLPINFQKVLSYRNKGVMGAWNDSLEGMWQDFLLVNPLNILTWPVVAHRVISILAYVNAIQQHEIVASFEDKGDLCAMKVKKGALLTIQVLEQYDNIGFECIRDRTAILDLWILLLNHYLCSTFWYPVVKNDGEEVPLSGLLHVEEKLVRGVNDTTSEMYLQLSDFVSDVQCVFEAHGKVSCDCSDVLEIQNWFEATVSSFDWASDLNEQTHHLCETTYLSALGTCMSCLTRFDAESFDKAKRLDVLRIFMHFGIHCEVYQSAVHVINQQNLGKFNEATGVGGIGTSNKKIMTSNPTASRYTELYPLVINPADARANTANEALKASSMLHKVVNSLTSVPVHEPIPFCKNKKSKMSETETTSPSPPPLKCCFTGLEPRHVSKGGDWVVVPKELLDVACVSSSGTDHIASDITIDQDKRSRRNKRLASESCTSPTHSGAQPVSLRSIVTKIAAVRNNNHMSRSAEDTSPGETSNAIVPPLSISLAHFYPPSEGKMSQYGVELGSKLDHVTRLLHTYPIGFDRTGREYFFCGAQMNNLVSGLNMHSGAIGLKEPGLLVRDKHNSKQWNYIQMDNIPSLLQCFEDSNPCEKFLRMRIQLQLSQIRKRFKDIICVTESQSDWLQDYEKTDAWLEQLKAQQGDDDSDAVRDLEVAHARAVECRLSVHSAIISYDLEDETHEYAYRGLSGVNWSNLSSKESRRLTELKRRHKRAKILELSMEFHPVKGWLRQHDSFERIRQLGAATIASRIHSEPHLADQMRVYNRRSRFITNATHTRFVQSLPKKNVIDNSGAKAYERMVTEADIPHLVPSSNVCSHRLIKMKVELLNIVALLPQENLNFKMTVKKEVIDEKENIETRCLKIDVADEKVDDKEISKSPESVTEHAEETLVHDATSPKKRGRDCDSETCSGVDERPEKKQHIAVNAKTSLPPVSHSSGNDDSDVVECSNEAEETTSTYTNTVVNVSVAEYVELVQKCSSPVDFFMLVVMLEQSTEKTKGAPVMLSTSVLSQCACSYGRRGFVADDTFHLCHAARRLYTLDRSLRYEELGRINATINRAINGRIKLNSEVNYRARVDYLPKCIQSSLCIRPMCHYNKCIAYNPRSSYTVYPSVPGFDWRSLYSSAAAIPSRFGKDLPASNLMLSVSSSGHVMSMKNAQLSGSIAPKRYDILQNYHGGDDGDNDDDDSSSRHSMDDSDTPEYQEQILDVSVVIPFLPKTADITESQWI